MYEPVSLWCCRSSGFCLAPLSPGWYCLAGDHIYSTLLRLHPLSPNLIITVSVLSSWHLFWCDMPSPNLLYSWSQSVCFSVSPYVGLNVFSFFFLALIVEMHLSKATVGTVGLEITSRHLKFTPCRVQATLYTERKPVMTAISFPSPKSHKITLKLQPWHYQVQVETDTIKPRR